MASKDVIKRIQHALARRGFDPGVVDGIWGRRTEGAARAFQRANGLIVDGIVGPKTWAALFEAEAAAPPSDNPAIPWFQEARRLIGVRERVGPGNNPVIVNWAGGAGIDYASDDIPWCGLFVAHCVSATLADETLPANPLGARNWHKFGAPCQPGLGAILVFWRGAADGWQGHVGFYVGESENEDHNDGAFHVLGGNQGDAVSITKIRRNRLLGARWPATAPIATPERVLLAGDQTFFSTNEA